MRRIYFFVFLFLGSVAYAQNYNIGTVKGLRSNCQHIQFANAGEKYDERSYGLCFGYFRGLKDTYDVMKLGGQPGKICTRQSTQWLDLIEAFMGWTNLNPEYDNELAWTGVVKSLSKHFPCNGNPAETQPHTHQEP